MALRSTIYKADLSVADIDRSHYGDHAMTIARHPSETEERMMLRVLAYGMYADEQLAFGRGLSTDDEPDLWLKDATGLIRQWIDVGLPEDKWVRKACGRARQVVVLAYGGHRAEHWWRQVSPVLERFENLTVLSVAPDACAALARMAGRSLNLSCTIQEGQVLIASAAQSVTVDLTTLKRPVG